MGPEDAQLVVQDLIALKKYFVQRDDEGNVNGLDEERVSLLLLLPSAALCFCSCCCTASAAAARRVSWGCCSATPLL